MVKRRETESRTKTRPEQGRRTLSRIRKPPVGSSSRPVGSENRGLWHVRSRSDLSSDRNQTGQLRDRRSAAPLRGDRSWFGGKRYVLQARSGRLGETLVVQAAHRLGPAVSGGIK